MQIENRNFNLRWNERQQSFEGPEMIHFLTQRNDGYPMNKCKSRFYNYIISFLLVTLCFVIKLINFGGVEDAPFYCVSCTKIAFLADLLFFLYRLIK